MCPRCNDGSYPNTRNNQNNNDSSNNHDNPPSSPPSCSNANQSQNSPPFKEVSNNITKREARLILGVTNVATKREITLRYRILSREYHPDKWSPNSKHALEMCTERFKCVANARDKLLDETWMNHCTPKKKNTHMHVHILFYFDTMSNHVHVKCCLISSCIG